jgi:hypothetical protein
MGRQPRSGDSPWLSAHSILNWIGGDIPMLDRLSQKSSVLSSILLKGLDNYGEVRSATAVCVDTKPCRMLGLMVS